MTNPWNTIQEIEFDPNIKKNIYNYFFNIKKYRYVTDEAKREHILNDNRLDQKSYDYLYDMYWNKEYGLKLLGRCLDLSYSQVRKLFIDYLKIEIRRGQDVVTSNVRKFRSERVKGNKNPWAYILPNHKKTTRGIQGYYQKKNNDYVWLRSSWEYIYAKWLDNNNINFKVEYIRFKLSNKSSYTPDFFIYENDILQYIVEIKGYKRKSSMDKIELFKKDYPHIKIIVVDNITSYCNNLKEEINIWRKIRLPKDYLLKK